MTAIVITGRSTHLIGSISGPGDSALLPEIQLPRRDVLLRGGGLKHEPHQ
jgi:hypothetical protein